MIILSKQERRASLARLEKYLPDVLVILVISLFAEKSGAVFFVLSGIVILAYVAAWLKRIVVDRISKRWGKQPELVATILKDLQQDGYPEPPNILNSATEYMYNIYKNPAYPVDLRIDAAYQSGALAALASRGMMDEYQQTCQALEEALVQYKQTFKENKEASE